MEHESIYSFGYAEGWAPGELECRELFGCLIDVVRVRKDKGLRPPLATLPRMEQRDPVLVQAGDVLGELLQDGVAEAALALLRHDHELADVAVRVLHDPPNSVPVNRMDRVVVHDR